MVLMADSESGGKSRLDCIRNVPGFKTSMQCTKPTQFVALTKGSDDEDGEGEIQVGGHEAIDRLLKCRPSIWNDVKCTGRLSISAAS